MKKYFDTLRPFEKRVVVGVGVALFAVLNFWFVLPHFSDMSKVQDRMFVAQAKLSKYRGVAKEIPTLRSQINHFISEGNADVPSEDRGNEFLRTINTEQARSGVSLTSSGRITTRTNNLYFVELSQTISVQSGEQQLVDFLYNLGSGPSLIRVRGLNLHPDPTRIQLAAAVTLVASFQKALAKPASAATASASAASAGKSSPSTANASTSTAKRP